MMGETHLSGWSSAPCLLNLTDASRGELGRIERRRSMRGKFGKGYFRQHSTDECHLPGICAICDNNLVPHFHAYVPNLPHLDSAYMHDVIDCEEGRRELVQELEEGKEGKCMPRHCQTCPPSAELCQRDLCMREGKCAKGSVSGCEEMKPVLKGNELVTSKVRINISKSLYRINELAELNRKIIMIGVDTSESSRNCLVWCRKYLIRDESDIVVLTHVVDPTRPLLDELELQNYQHLPELTHARKKEAVKLAKRLVGNYYKTYLLGCDVYPMILNAFEQDEESGHEEAYEQLDSEKGSKMNNAKGGIGNILCKSIKILRPDYFIVGCSHAHKYTDTSTLKMTSFISQNDLHKPHKYNEFDTLPPNRNTDSISLSQLSTERSDNVNTIPFATWRKNQTKKNKKHTLNTNHCDHTLNNIPPLNNPTTHTPPNNTNFNHLNNPSNSTPINKTQKKRIAKKKLSPNSEDYSDDSSAHSQHTFTCNVLSKQNDRKSYDKQCDKNIFYGEQNKFSAEKNMFIGEKNIVNAKKNIFNGEKNRLNGNRNMFNAEKHTLSEEKKLYIEDKNLFIEEKNILNGKSSEKKGSCEELSEHYSEGRTRPVVPLLQLKNEETYRGVDSYMLSYMSRNEDILMRDDLNESMRSLLSSRDYMEQVGRRDIPAQNGSQSARIPQVGQTTSNMQTQEVIVDSPRNLISDRTESRKHTSNDPLAILRRLFKGSLSYYLLQHVPQNIYLVLVRANQTKTKIKWAVTSNMPLHLVYKKDQHKHSDSGNETKGGERKRRDSEDDIHLLESFRETRKMVGAPSCNSLRSYGGDDVKLWAFGTQDKLQ